MMKRTSNEKGEKRLPATAVDGFKKLAIHLPNQPPADLEGSCDAELLSTVTDLR